ncbi:MAG: hypothetical protein V9G18_13505 [Albidovulum sp.]
MNADIRISVGFPDHPKTVKLDRRLGFQGVRSLLALWTWAAQNRPDGDLGGANGRSTAVRRPLDEEDIEIAARWPGEPGLFVATLVALGWLDRTERGYLLHEWQQHNPWVAAATDRSDKARFSRVAKTHPDIYKSLCARGIRAVSAEEFARLKAGWSPDDRLTGVEEAFDGRSRFVERPLNDRSTTVVRPFNERATPSPSPSPKERKEKEKRGARETAPPDRVAVGTPPAPTRWVASPVTEIDKIVDAIEIGEAREDGDDETLAASEASASPAIIASPAIAPEARGTAGQTAELAAEQTAAPGSVAGGPSDAGSAAVAPPAKRGWKGRRDGAANCFGVPVTLPDWLSADAWQAFVEHRKALKHPLTPAAILLTLRDLTKAREFGHDPVTLIETAIGNGWRGCVYPDKHFQPPAGGFGGAGRGRPSADPRVAEWQAIMAGERRAVLEGEVCRDPC